MGMAVGNHSYNHPEVPPFDQLPQPLMRDEIALERSGARTARRSHPAVPAARRQQLGVGRPRSPPALGQRVVLWSVDPADWEAGSHREGDRAAGALSSAAGLDRDLHDGGGDRSATLGALPAIVRGIRARGLRLVTLAPGVGPVAQTSPAG